MDETESGTVNVVDHLNSQSATDALSAKQGFVLRQMIEQITTPEIATEADIDAMFTTTAAEE